MRREWKQVSHKNRSGREWFVLGWWVGGRWWDLEDCGSMRETPTSPFSAGSIPCCLQSMYKSNILGQSVQRGRGEGTWIDCPAGSSPADGEGGQGVAGRGGQAQHHPRGRRLQDSCRCHCASAHRSFELLVFPRKVNGFLHQERWTWPKMTKTLCLK